MNAENELSRISKQINTKKIIFDHLKEVQGIIPTDRQYKEIQNKKTLATLILNGTKIEWEFTVVCTSSCYSCCSDGAKTWVMDNLSELYTVSVSKIIWNPNWQELG